MGLVCDTSMDKEIPFDTEGRYTAPISISICTAEGSPMTLIEVVGDRVKLVNFQGDYVEQLHDAFGDRIVPREREKEDLLEIFGNREVVASYGSGSPKDASQVEALLERDASRPIHGELFTGLAVVDLATEKVIGRVSLGSGREIGDAESGLILHKAYQGQRIGLETICLTAALANVYFENQYTVVSRRVPAPVKRFTATTLDSNERLKSLVERIGMSYIRALRSDEKSTDEPKSLYGIEASKVGPLLPKLIDVSKVHVSIEQL